MTRSKVKVKVMSPSKLEIRPFSTAILRLLQLELATDHGFLNYGTISKFDWARYLIFLVSVSCDFELGRNVSCEDLTISPVWG